MSKPQKPPAVFEVVLDGPGVYPERIPLGALTEAFSAVRRLAAGREADDRDEEDEQHTLDEDAIRLLDVKRGSAVFRFVGRSPISALKNLRIAGTVLEDPDQVGDNDYVLRPID